jgi:hypothetical protein
MNIENSENQIVENTHELNFNTGVSKRDSEILLKEEIEQACSSASEKAEEWIQLSNEFQTVKKALKPRNLFTIYKTHFGVLQLFSYSQTNHHSTKCHCLFSF